MTDLNDYTHSMAINFDGKVMPNVNAQLVGSNSKGKETLSVSGVAVGFATIPAGATKAFVTNETSKIRYWVDSSTPTTTEGHLLNAGDLFELDSAGQLTNFKAIAVSGTAALQITYF